MTTYAPSFSYPISVPAATTTTKMPLAYYTFAVAGGNSPALVYKDAYLKVPFAALTFVNGAAATGTTSTVYADAAGNFPPIYLDPNIAYRVTLYNQSGAQQWQVDPYNPPLPVTGNRSVNVNPNTGEVQINAPASGGSGVTLTVGRNSTSLAVYVQAPTNIGTPIAQFLNTLTTGTQTATFTATNKPGSAGGTPWGWWPILGDGGVNYYIPLWQS
jgi:hypothetical protein